MLSVTLFLVACTPVVSVVLGSSFSELLNRPSYSFEEYFIENASKLFVTSILVLLSACAFVAWRWSRWPKGPQPPIYPGALPIIGYLHKVIFLDFIGLWKLLKELNSFCMNHGGVIQFNIGPKVVYMLTDPDDCYTVSNALISKPYLYKFAKSFLNRGLVTAEPSDWKPSRKMFNTLFSQRILNTYMNVFNETGRSLVNKFAETIGKGKFSHDSYLITNALELACQTTLGLKFEDKNTEGYAYMHAVEGLFETYIRRLTKFWLHIDLFFKFSSIKKEHDEFLKTSKGITKAVIAKRKLLLKDVKKDENEEDISNDKYRPFVDTLLEVQKKEGLTDGHLREHVDTMIVAIYDTTATTLTFLFTMIGSFPRVQDQIYKELREVLGDSDRDVDRKDLAKLVYTEAVIKETLRLHTAFPFIGREITQEVKLKKYTLAQGGFCIISLQGLHLHPLWGEDADQFRPERWLEPGGVPSNSNLFAGFSIGKRSCIGKVYAMMSMKTTVAHVLRRYRVHADYTNMIIKWNAFKKPSSGHEISLELRT